VWTPAAEIAAEVTAALAEAGEISAPEITLESESDEEVGGLEEAWDLEDAEDAEDLEDVGSESDVEATSVFRVPVLQRAAAQAPVIEAPAVQAPVVREAVPPAASSGPTPEQISRHIARAEALAELGRRQQALDVLNELIVAGAEDVRVWRALAAVHLEIGDGEKALRAADWVVTFEPADEWGFRLRASALRLLQRPEEAVSAAAEAVRLDSGVWQGHATLAMALHSTGDLSAAAAEARKAAEMAERLDPGLAPEAQQVEAAVQAVQDEAALVQNLESDLESALAGPPGLDDESLEHVGNLVLRALEFSAGAGWVVSFGGIAIPGFNFRFLIPLAVLAILGVFLVGPARRAGRDIWRYLVEYLWQDPKTRSVLLMAVAAHVWMIAGSSVGHLQGGSALGIGLLTHLTGRTVLAKKAPELNPVRRTGPTPVPATAPPASG
jgi:tetratricopeptide (TPR) repeat protein